MSESTLVMERLEALLEDMRLRIIGLEERMKPEPLMFAYPDAAKRLGVGITKLREMVKRGSIRATKNRGEAPMISLTELQRYATPTAERPKVEASQRAAAWAPIARKKSR